MTDGRFRDPALLGGALLGFSFGGIEALRDTIARHSQLYREEMWLVVGMLSTGMLFLRVYLLPSVARGVVRRPVSAELGN